MKTIIFDFDGLLADSEPVYVDCNKRCLEQLGVKNFNIEDKLFGMRAEEAFEVIKNEYKLKYEISDMIKIRNAFMIKDFEEGKLKMMPFAIDCINSLYKKYPLAIGSSSKKDLLDSALKIYNIRNFFEVIVCGDDVKKGKPEPDIYLKVAKELNEKPENCVIIEDSPHGITSGKKAGMISVAIPNEYTKKLNFYTKPDYIIDNLGMLESLMRKI